MPQVVDTGISEPDRQTQGISFLQIGWVWASARQIRGRLRAGQRANPSPGLPQAKIYPKVWRPVAVSRLGRCAARVSDGSRIGSDRMPFNEKGRGNTPALH
jgi:hypothetical protein